jgi:hypothetical protein
MEQDVLMWLLGLVGIVFSGLIIYVLNGINQSVQGLRDEVRTLNTNLVRIDRRVAYLEGRMSDKGIHREEL